MPESNKIQSGLLARARLFRTVFEGREDVVPRYWESGNGRSGVRAPAGLLNKARNLIGNRGGSLGV